MPSLTGLAGFLVLAVLPGAWIACLLGGPLPARALWLLGIALSPLCLYVEYCALRLAGVDFESTALWLVAGNVLAGLWLWQRLRRPRPSAGSLAFACDQRELLGHALVLAPVAAWLAGTQWWLPDLCRYWGHTWMHSDLVYGLARGQLPPEEPELAGFAAAYPWAGHVYQALLSHWLDRAPVASYPWTNLVWLGLALACVRAVVRTLGGGGAACYLTTLCTLLLVSTLGYVVLQVAPRAWAEEARWHLWGDWRHTPWVWPFRMFHQLPIAIGLCAAVVWSLLEPAWRQHHRRRAAAVCAVLTTLGIVYPILFPAAWLVAALCWLVESSLRRRLDGWLLLGLMLCGGLAYWHLQLLTSGRTGLPVRNSWLTLGVRKLLELLVMAAPLLAACWLGRRRLRAVERLPLMTLCLGALACGGLWVGLYLPNFYNEYKFVFPMVVCAAPLAGIALASKASSLGRWTPWIAGAVASALVLVPVHKTIVTVRREQHHPRVDASRFWLALADDEPLASLCAAIRARTPDDAVLLVDRIDLHLPTVTGRQLYIAPHHAAELPGIWLRGDNLLRIVRGYDPALLDLRQAQRDTLFHAANDVERARAFAAIHGIGRPLAVLVETGRHSQLEHWLRTTGGVELFRGGGFGLWSTADPP